MIKAKFRQIAASMLALIATAAFASPSLAASETGAAADQLAALITAAAGTAVDEVSTGPEVDVPSDDVSTGETDEQEQTPLDKILDAVAQVVADAADRNKPGSDADDLSHADTETEGALNNEPPVHAEPVSIESETESETEADAAEFGNELAEESKEQESAGEDKATLLAISDEALSAVVTDDEDAEIVGEDDEDAGMVGEIVDPNKIKFVKGEPERRIVAVYKTDDKDVETECLGGGTVYQGRDEVEVTSGLTYRWYLTTIPGTVQGSILSKDELYAPDQYHGLTPFIASQQHFYQAISMDGTEVGKQTYTIQFSADIPSFTLSSSGAASAAASKDSPIVLTAQIPDGYDASVQNALRLSNDLGANVTLRRSAVRWFPSGYGEVGTDAAGRPTLTLSGAAQAQDGREFRCIIDYEIVGDTRTGVVRAHSDKQVISLAAETLPPYWASAEPGTSDASVVQCDRFKYPPVTEAELRQMYKEMVLPYYDPAYRNEPFKLMPASTNADGTLTDVSKAQLFNLINFVRRCAGVDPLAAIDPVKSDYAQAAAAFMSENNTIGHYAAVGSGNTKADHGLQHSNLSWGSITGGAYDLTRMQFNQLNDDDPTTMAVLGHRRWLLDNRLTSTGFGYAGPVQSNKSTHLVTYIMDDSVNGYSQPGRSLEAYPGIGAFPVELMTFGAWSLSLGDGTRAPSTGVRMSVTRVPVNENDTAETVELERLANPSSAYYAKGSWFSVNNTGCGSGPVILFSPAQLFKNGNVRDGKQLLGNTYTICITGLTTQTGYPSDPVVYSTRFVSLADMTDQYDPAATPPAAPVIPGSPVPPTNPETPGGNENVTPAQPVMPTVTPRPVPTPVPTPEPTQPPATSAPVQVVPPLPDPPAYPVVVPGPAVVPDPTESAPSSSNSAEQSAEPSSSASAAAASEGSSAPSANVVSSAGTSPEQPLIAASPSSLISVLGSSESGGQYVLVAVPKEPVASDSKGLMSVADLTKSLDAPGGTVSVVKSDGTPAQPDAPAATGMVVRTTGADGQIRSEHVVVVPYDVLGTGIIDLTQVVRLARAYVGTDPLEGIYLRAASQIEPGRVLLTDLVRQVNLFRAILH